MDKIETYDAIVELLDGLESNDKLEVLNQLAALRKRYANHLKKTRRKDASDAFIKRTGITRKMVGWMEARPRKSGPQPSSMVAQAEYARHLRAAGIGYMEWCNALYCVDDVLNDKFAEPLKCIVADIPKS